MNINPELLGQSLEIMGLGMAGIFIVLTVLLIAVKVLINIFPEKKGKEKPKTINTEKIEKVEKVDSAPNKPEDELTAAIIAAISEDINIPLDKFKITSICET